MSTVTVLRAKKMELEARLRAGADAEELESIKRELIRVETALDLLEPVPQNAGDCRTGRQQSYLGVNRPDREMATSGAASPVAARLPRGRG